MENENTGPGRLSDISHDNDDDDAWKILSHFPRVANFRYPGIRPHPAQRGVHDEYTRLIRQPNVYVGVVMFMPTGSPSQSV